MVLLTAKSATSDNADFAIEFDEPLRLDPDRKYKIALVGGNGYYAPLNVSTAGNLIEYTADGGGTWETVAVSAGLYTYVSLNLLLASVMEANGDWNTTDDAAYIVIDGNLSTGYTTITRTSANYELKFYGDVATIVGAEAGTAYGAGDLPNPPLYDKGVNSIFVHCSLVATGASYYNGASSQVLYVKNIDATPFDPLSFQSTAGGAALFLPCVSGTYSRVRIWLTTDDGATPYYTPGYPTTVSLMVLPAD